MKEGEEERDTVKKGGNPETIAIIHANLLEQDTMWNVNQMTVTFLTFPPPPEPQRRRTRTSTKSLIFNAE